MGKGEMQHLGYPVGQQANLFLDSSCALLPLSLPPLLTHPRTRSLEGTQQEK